MVDFHWLEELVFYFAYAIAQIKSDWLHGEEEEEEVEVEDDVDRKKRRKIYKLIAQQATNECLQFTRRKNMASSVFVL